MQSISFQLKNGQEPFVIDFDKFNLSVLESISRLLNIEDYEKELIIKVSDEMYWEIGLWLSGNAWVINFKDQYGPDGYHLYLNGKKFLIKPPKNINLNISYEATT